MRIATLSLLTIVCLVLAAPGFAGTLFTSGATIGTINGYFVDGPNTGPFGQWISDGFTDTTTGTATQITIGLWSVGGAPNAVSYNLGSTSFGTLTPGTSVTSAFLFTNGFGYGIYNTTFNITPTALTGGTPYYLSIGLANNTGGTQEVAWDDIENPAVTCYFTNPSGTGGCPTTESEAFTISGGPVGSTPEPSSIMLFGSGILGLAGVLRRKMTR